MVRLLEAARCQLWRSKIGGQNNVVGGQQCTDSDTGQKRGDNGSCDSRDVMVVVVVAVAEAVVIISNLSAKFVVFLVTQW